MAKFKPGDICYHKEFEEYCTIQQEAVQNGSTITYAVIAHRDGWICFWSEHNLTNEIDSDYEKTLMVIKLKHPDWFSK